MEAPAVLSWQQGSPCLNWVMDLHHSPHHADFHSRPHEETLAAWCSGVAGTLLAGRVHACGFWETL